MPPRNIPSPRGIIKSPIFESILDFPNAGSKPKKEPRKNPIRYNQNNYNPCPSCGGGMDESTNYYTCIECGYQVRK